MEFDLPVNFKNLDFNLLALIFGIYFILIGIAYYLIFHKHHKKNKVELDELVSLVTKFYTLIMFSTFMIVLGIFCILNSNNYKDSRTDVILGVSLGIIIIYLAIMNIVFYVKSNLKDLSQEERELTKKAIIKIGEILQIIFFIIFLLMPIWRIPVFIDVYEDRKELFKELIRAFGLSIASIILLIALNPTDFKGKIKRFFNKNKLKEEKNKNKNKNKNRIKEDVKESKKTTSKTKVKNKNKNKENNNIKQNKTQKKNNK